MAKKTAQAMIEFLDADGVSRGTMGIYGDEGTIVVIAESEQELSWPKEGDEPELAISLEPVQVLEGHRYDYVLESVPDGSYLEYENNPCIIPHRADSTKGHLEPGTYTGLLQLGLSNGEGRIASACVEVQSAKAGSLRHYVTMVGDIAERSTELLMQATSPSQARFESFGEQDAETLTQRFCFLEALLGRRSFQDALERIVRNPHIRSTGEMVEKNLSRGGFPIRANELRQIASRYPRVELPPDHPVRMNVPDLESVPVTVITREHRDFTDTPENRFIKHALRHFMYALEEIAEALKVNSNGNAGEKVAKRATALAEKLEGRLSHSFFRELSPPAFLPLGSPVLQRKEGYREVLGAWLKFDLASQLVWKGGDEVFGAGKRDVAKLYEFWLCFKLEEAVGQVFKMDKTPDLIKPTDNGLELTLESGKSLDWQGQYFNNSIPLLNIRFSFNRTFSGQGKSTKAEHGSHINYGLGKEGAWTAQMRPDYTITLWPVNMAESKAEKEEQIVHLHFDAKYRVQSVSNAKGSPINILDLFGDQGTHIADDEEADLAESAGLGDEGGEGVEEQEKAEKEGRLSKRADLLKMHAYRDAIRRSEGAYVLYPGTHEKRWAAYHELLPGIGAFPVCPGSNDDMKSVADFLGQAADLCVDRFSQLYRQRYWTENIMAEAPDDSYKGWIPPGLRTPPLDTGVMLGFIRRGAVELCREQGIFYFHAVDKDRQPIDFDPRILTAGYIVPFSTASKPSGGGHASTQWLDWWAEIESISMVHRHSLGKYAGLFAQLKSAMNVEYYYLATLKRQDDGSFVRQYNSNFSPPAVSAPLPRRPNYATWKELWSHSAETGGFEGETPLAT